MDEYINGWSIKQATDQLMLDAPHTYTHMPLGSAHGISDRIHSVRASIRDYFNAPSCPLNRFCHADRSMCSSAGHMLRRCSSGSIRGAAKMCRCLAAAFRTNKSHVRIGSHSQKQQHGGKANLEDVHHGGRFRILFFQPTGTLYGSPGF